MKYRITEVRRRVLMNIRQGRDPFEGFHGSQLGGAVRSINFMRGVGLLVVWDTKFECWKLTDTGLRALDQERRGGDG